jgi:hypothetical protein
MDLPGDGLSAAVAEPSCNLSTGPKRLELWNIDSLLNRFKRFQKLKSEFPFSSVGCQHLSRANELENPANTGSLVLFTALAGCLMNLAMQPNLPKSISHPNQSFRRHVVGFCLLGSIHPRHMNDANGRCRTNIGPINQGQQSKEISGGLRFGALRLTI